MSLSLEGEQASCTALSSAPCASQAPPGAPTSPQVRTWPPLCGLCPSVCVGGSPHPPPLQCPSTLPRAAHPEAAVRSQPLRSVLHVADSRWTSPQLSTCHVFGPVVPRKSVRRTHLVRAPVPGPQPRRGRVWPRDGDSGAHAQGAAPAGPSGCGPCVTSARCTRGGGGQVLP